MTDDPILSLATYLREHLDDPDFGTLVEAVASACWSISKAVRESALNGHLGESGQTNVQGEEQKPLDILADDLFMRACRTSSRLAATVSEEVEQVTWLKDPVAGDFVLSFDPLDGSSNLDVNIAVGSIFSIARVDERDMRNVLISGRDVICAGYAIYGPSTMLVLTFGSRVDGFTLDLDQDDFVLTHSNMLVPTDASEFAINMSRQRLWDAQTHYYIDGCLAGPNGPRGKAFNMRWTASMVADVHRILMRGGIFLYPVDQENKPKGGRLRLLYEAIPMAKIIEVAGGLATDGQNPILGLCPTNPHERVGVILGSRNEVARASGDPTA